MPARERQLAFVRLERLLGARVVVDLLAAPLLVLAVEDDDRAAERESARDLALERLEAIALDLERTV